MDVAQVLRERVLAHFGTDDQPTAPNMVGTLEWEVAALVDALDRPAEAVAVLVDTSEELFDEFVPPVEDVLVEDLRRGWRGRIREVLEQLVDVMEG